jgi:copper(I)-binding protein
MRSFSYAAIAATFIVATATLTIGHLRHASAQAPASFTKGPVTVTQPWSRATPNGAPVAGGYLVVANKGAEGDKLLGGMSDIAARVEIHEMSMNNGVMQMRPVAGGLTVPAGGSVELKPGGYHVMFMGLKHGIKEGERFKVTLQFEKAGPVDVDFSVGSIGAQAAPAGGGHAH